jgi:hypothetical protein
VHHLMLHQGGSGDTAALTYLQASPELTINYQQRLIRVRHKQANPVSVPSKENLDTAGWYVSCPQQYHFRRRSSQKAQIEEVGVLRRDHVAFTRGDIPVGGII